MLTDIGRNTPSTTAPLVLRVLASILLRNDFLRRVPELCSSASSLASASFDVWRIVQRWRRRPRVACGGSSDSEKNSSTPVDGSPLPSIVRSNPNERRAWATASCVFSSPGHQLWTTAPALPATAAAETAPWFFIRRIRPVASVPLNVDLCRTGRACAMTASSEHVAAGRKWRQMLSQAVRHLNYWLFISILHFVSLWLMLY